MVLGERKGAKELIRLKEEGVEEELSENCRKKMGEQNRTDAKKKGEGGEARGERNKRVISITQGGEELPS